jgi:hypothetical protein
VFTARYGLIPYMKHVTFRLLKVNIGSRLCVQRNCNITAGMIKFASEHSDVGTFTYEALLRLVQVVSSQAVPEVCGRNISWTTCRFCHIIPCDWHMVAGWPFGLCLLTRHFFVVLRNKKKFKLQCNFRKFVCSLGMPCGKSDRRKTWRRNPEESNLHKPTNCRKKFRCFAYTREHVVRGNIWFVLRRYLFESRPRY